MEMMEMRHAGSHNGIGDDAKNLEPHVGDCRLAKFICEIRKKCYWSYDGEKVLIKINNVVKWVVDECCLRV